MIPDESVRNLFPGFETVLKRYWYETVRAGQGQFVRGVSPLHWGDNRANCWRHKLIFKTYNIIPRHCFSCYKVSIDPRNVLELFKLMMVFEGLKLPNDNTRKCLTEKRPDISGTYKGLIYCQSLDEARNIHAAMQGIISEQISPKIAIYIKRGCSEYPLVYPEYNKFDQDGNPVMKYKEEWQEYENLVDRERLAFSMKDIYPNTYNHPNLTAGDIRVMISWIRYAAHIGDKSYMKITQLPVPGIELIKERPPFKTEDED